MYIPTRRAHRKPPTDMYSPNVGSIYPIQINIFVTKGIFRNPYPIHQNINSADWGTSNQIQILL